MSCTSLFTNNVLPIEHMKGEEGSSLEISCGTQSLTTSTDIPTFSDTTTNPQTTFSNKITHPQTGLSNTQTRTQTTLNDFKTSEQITLFMSSATPMIDKSQINDNTDSNGK